MASPMARPTSSSSESGSQRVAVDQRKRRRMESNRESARRSRMRKQQRLDELVHEVSRLKEDNSRLEAGIESFAQQFGGIDAENAVLTAQVAELTARLQSLNSVLRFVEDFSGMALDIPEIPDPLLRPWHLPRPSQPITASVDMPEC